MLADNSWDTTSKVASVNEMFREFMKRLLGTIGVTGGTAVQTLGFGNFRPLGSVEGVAETLEGWAVDEILLLSFHADEPRSGPDLSSIRRALDGAPGTPLAYGGGVRTVDDARRALSEGADRIVISRVIHEDPLSARSIVEYFGRESVIGVIHVGTGPPGRGSQSGRQQTPRRIGSTPVQQVDLRLGRTGNVPWEWVVVSPERLGITYGFDEDLLDLCNIDEPRLIPWAGFAVPQQIDVLLSRMDVAAVAFDHRLLFREISLGSFRRDIGYGGVRQVEGL